MPSGIKNTRAAQAASGGLQQPDEAPASPSLQRLHPCLTPAATAAGTHSDLDSDLGDAPSRRRAQRWIQQSAAAGTSSDLDILVCISAGPRRWREQSLLWTNTISGAASALDLGLSTASGKLREQGPCRTTDAAVITDLDLGLGTVPGRSREQRLMRTEAGAGVNADPGADYISTAPSRRRWRILTTLHPHPLTLTFPPHSPHSPSIPRRHTPRGRSCTLGFPGDRFSSLGGTGGPTSTLHTPIHPFLTSFTFLYTPYTSSSPQAETSTYVHCHGRRRRHRSRHDGAVAYLAQPPAATSRCRNLPASLLTDRAGQEPSQGR